MTRDEQQGGGLTLAIWLLASFAALTLLVVAGLTQSLDDAWNTAMVNAETPWLVSVAEAFHKTGATPIALPTALLVGVAFLSMRRWLIAGAWIVMVGGAQILSTVTKVLVGRERPLDGLVHESSAAYPSGHAMVSGAAMAIGLAVLLGFLWPNRHRLFLGVGISYAALMALSRTYLQAHWLTDVVAGLILGITVVLLVVAVMSRRSGFRR